MIGISKLYMGTVEPSDALRYGRESGKLPSHLLQFSKDKKPVITIVAVKILKNLFFILILLYPNYLCLFFGCG